MKGVSKWGARLLVLAACAVALALPTTAKVAPATELQVVASGHDGMAATRVVCQRVHQARLCFQGTKPTCPAGGC